MAEAGFEVVHVYGLTEVYGPYTICAWHDEWNALPASPNPISAIRCMTSLNLPRENENA